MKTKPLICGLSKYGIDFKDIEKLGDKVIRVSVAIKCTKEEYYFKYPPKLRKKKIEKWYRDAYKEIVSRWPTNIIEKEGSNRCPQGFVAEINAKDFPIVEKINEIYMISILDIKELKEKKQEEGERKEYFAVKARFEEQIEALEKGLIKYEDRIIIVKATDFEDAEIIAMKNFKAYEHSYLIYPDFLRAQWKFEKILDIYEIGVEKINPNGTEVYSEIRYRRMKPEHEWHPKYE